jgi:hypothetical protein
VTGNISPAGGRHFTTELLGNNAFTSLRAARSKEAAEFTLLESTFEQIDLVSRPVLIIGPSANDGDFGKQVCLKVFDDGRPHVPLHIAANELLSFITLRCLPAPEDLLVLFLKEGVGKYDTNFVQLCIKLRTQKRLVVVLDNCSSCWSSQAFMVYLCSRLILETTVVCITDSAPPAIRKRLDFFVQLHVEDSTTQAVAVAHATTLHAASSAQAAVASAMTALNAAGMKTGGEDSSAKRFKSARMGFDFLGVGFHRAASNTEHSFRYCTFCDAFLASDKFADRTEHPGPDCPIAAVEEKKAKKRKKGKKGKKGGKKKGGKKKGGKKKGGKKRKKK